MISEIGQDSYFHLAARLELLNNLHPMERNLERIITQYKQGNISNFEKSCAQIPNIKLKSHKKRGYFGSAILCNINYVISIYTS